MMINDQWIEVAKICGGLVVFTVGLLQYRRAQSWKRLEFVAAEIAKFRTDPMVAKVCLMLDWRERRVSLGSGLEVDGRPPKINYEIVTSALVPDTGNDRYTPLQAGIRDHFDAFLERLAHLQTFVDAGLVNKEDLKPYLNYWTNALAGGGNIDEKLLEQFWKFVDAYEYSAVRRLVSGFHPKLAQAFPEGVVQGSKT